MSYTVNNQVPHMINTVGRSDPSNNHRLQITIIPDFLYNSADDQMLNTVLFSVLGKNRGSKGLSSSTVILK
jgi:hypothetical protein